MKFTITGHIKRLCCQQFIRAYYREINFSLSGLPPRQPFLRLGPACPSRTQIPRNFNQCRHNKCCTSHPQDHSSDKTRQVRILPDPEHAERPVDPDRDKGQEQPYPRQRLGFKDRSPNRIHDQSRQQPRINPKTPRTNGELMAFDKKRAVRYLMADIAEELVDRARNVSKPVSREQGCCYDDKYPS